jgi:transposase InsO family protein
MDNAPAYNSKNWKQFCLHFGIILKTWIPYNPQGQGIVEQAHHLTLKANCQNKKGE